MKSPLSLVVSASLALVACSSEVVGQAVQESTLALARRCEQFDPDGLTV